MKQALFVTGGCRSGKSKFALRFADHRFKKRAFIATCRAQDKEMVERIKEHQKVRGPEWQTVEVSTELPEAVTVSGEVVLSYGLIVSTDVAYGTFAPF